LAANMRLRWWLASEGARLLGGHLYAVALPWLVMQLTGSAAAMGTALILAGIPRTFLMAGCGVLADRFSPLRVLRVTGALRAVLLGALTALLCSGQATLPVLYGFSFVSGLLDAIFLPARNAVLPQVVNGEHLAGANALCAGLEQALGLAGPLLAGVGITALNRMGGGWLGTAAALGLDALAVLVSLALSGPLGGVRWIATEQTAGGLRQSLGELLGYLRREDGVRAGFVLIFSTNFLSVGVLWVGMPMLAVSRFAEGAAALGLLTSLLGCGALLGAALAGWLPLPAALASRRGLGGMLGLLLSGLAALLCAGTLPAAGAAVLAVGMLTSYVNVAGLAHVQRLTPPALMGRMMGPLSLK